MSLASKKRTSFRRRRRNHLEFWWTYICSQDGLVMFQRKRKEEAVIYLSSFKNGKDFRDHNILIRRMETLNDGEIFFRFRSYHFGLCFGEPCFPHPRCFLFFFSRGWNAYTFLTAFVFDRALPMPFFSLFATQSPGKRRRRRRRRPPPSPWPTVASS